MTSLLVIGECMMELSAQDDLYYARAFAGDTYNAAVYAKRWCPELEVSYLSAVGTDAISDAMLEQWLTEGIDCLLVVRSEDAPPASIPSLPMQTVSVALFTGGTILPLHR